ncbi:MAG: magnesium transporter [Planctomycetota bacterium]|nr:magnesium transporter [Planctomycetota bacterium]
MRPLESLLRTFAELHPEDAARAFETVELAERVRLFKTLPVRVAVSLLERSSPHTSAPLLRELDTSRAGELLRELSPRVASSVLHQLDATKRDEILATLTDDVSRSLGELARYPANTAGGIMEPRVASLSIDLTTQQAISAIRKAPREALHYLYVTQRDGTLSGVLNMRDLLLAAPRDPIDPLVRRNVVSVPDTMDSEEVVQLMRDRGFLALPVVDFEGRLIGVVKHAEALQAGQEAAFEDLQKLVGAGADERALSPVSLVVKSRLPWLCVNLVTAFMAAAVVGAFEGIIAKVAALAVLLPVVAGQGGNTGSQSLAVVMRGLALREIIPGVKKRVIVKELLGGTINGIVVAIITGVAVFGWRTVAGDTMQAGLGLSLVIGLAMVVNMAAAAISGAVIPLVLRAIGRDPAQSASIFLTTVTDIVGFASFLGFATAFMPMIA